MSRLLLSLTLATLLGQATAADASPAFQSQKPSLRKKKKRTKKQSLVLLAKAVGVVAIPSFVVGEYMMHASFVRGIYHWATYQRNVQHAFFKNPTGATYSVTVTLRDAETTMRRTFNASVPTELIEKVDTFLRETITQENYLVRVLIEPRIVTKTGKKISFAPLYTLWNKEHGVALELEKKFFLAGTTLSDDIFETVKNFTIGSVLSAPLLLLICKL